MTYQIEGKSKRRSFSVTMLRRTVCSSHFQRYFCYFSCITKLHIYSESASLSFIQIFFVYQCSVRKPNDISMSRDPNLILVKTQSLDTMEIIPVWSLHESWFWPLRTEIICEIGGGLAYRIKAGWSLKLIIFSDVPIYLYVNTLKTCSGLLRTALLLMGMGSSSPD